MFKQPWGRAVQMSVTIKSSGTNQTEPTSPGRRVPEPTRRVRENPVEYPYQHHHHHYLQHHWHRHEVQNTLVTFWYETKSSLMISYLVLGNRAVSMGYS